VAAEDDDEIEGRIAVMAGRGSPWPMAKTCGGAACIGSDAGGVLPGAGVGAELFFNVEAQARCIGSGSRFIDEPIKRLVPLVVKPVGESSERTVSEPISMHLTLRNGLSVSMRIPSLSSIAVLLNELAELRC
jgi:hypothetical protein